jgi:hypothetical protein
MIKFDEEVEVSDDVGFIHPIVAYFMMDMRMTNNKCNTLYPIRVLLRDGNDASFRFVRKIENKIRVNICNKDVMVSREQFKYLEEARNALKKVEYDILYVCNNRSTGE